MNLYNLSKIWDSDLQIKLFIPNISNAEILTFAEFIRNKRENSIQLTDLEDPKLPWPEFVRSLAGAWADDFSDLETIRVGMGQDIPRENL